METVADEAALVKTPRHHMYKRVKIVNMAVWTFLHYTCLGADGWVSNSWNEWQRAHKGLGLSPSEYSAMYRQARVKVVQRKDVLNAWNLWKRAHKGQGLSALERSACYKRENLSLCESEIPQELANAGAGRTSAATPVGGGIAQSVIPRSLSGDPLGFGIPSPAKLKDIYRFCEDRLQFVGKFDPYTQMLDVAMRMGSVA